VWLNRLCGRCTGNFEVMPEHLTVHPPSKYGKIYSEDSGFLVCDTAAWGELLPTFRKTVVPSSSRVRTCFLVSLPLKMKAPRFFWDVGNHSFNAERPIPEDRNPSRIRGSEDLKPRIVLSDQRCAWSLSRHCPS